jgi:hypothetical protein
MISIFQHLILRMNLLQLYVPISIKLQVTEINYCTDYYAQ